MSNSVKLLAIKHAIFEMGLKFNQEPSDAKITAYAKDLMDYTPEQITFAFRQVIKSGSDFFPSLARIISHLTPDAEKKEDRAPIIAREVVTLIRSWHPDLEDKMRELASPDALLVFQAIGNTMDLRNSETYEIMNAQVERFVKGVLAAKTNNIKNERLERLGINTGKVLEFRTMDYSNFLESKPGDPA